MKLHADPLTSLNTVTGYGPGFIDINQVRHQGSLVVTPDLPVEPFGAGAFEAIVAEHFTALLARAPEVVLLGTGSRQRFVHPALTRPLTQRHIGVECMDTAAACRTYNILMSESRRVVAVFLQDTGETR